ncbi:MAG: 8-oxo-dGTP diphosphatase [Ilumatobacteraceae bacterium]|jgi:8-oxo-dGTP diphosphatase
MLYLVRHGKAGSRSNFHGDDRMRPLSPAGYRQAQALAERLTAEGVTSLVSSPFLRCIETLQPTAQAVGVEIAMNDGLAEGRSGFDVIALLEALPDFSAACSHGDVIPETIAALERRGCEITSPPDWRKGSVWVLDRSSAGEITKAYAWPPPDVG